MTTDMSQPSLAVHSVDEFVFSVPDLEAARHFYASFGLDVRDEDGALALYAFGHPHRWARVVSGAGAKRLLWLAFGIRAEDESRFAAHVAEREIARIAPPAGASPEGIWIEGPDGMPVQLRVAEKSSPSQPAPREFPAANANHGRAPNRSQAQQVRPLYLSHILLFTADVEAARRFYEEVLGLRVSDHSGSVIAFLHTPHGSDHHLLALAKSNGGGLHHSSWCVPSFDAVGLGAQQMEHAGYGQGWGVGRHVVGSNYFRYVRDPWGSYLHLSLEQMGLVLSAIGFGGTLGTLIMPGLSDRFGRKPIMVVSVLGAAAGLFVLMHTGAEPYRLFFSLFATLFFVFSLICLTVGPISAESVPATLMSSAAGIVIGTGEIFGGGVAPVIAGYVAQNFGIQYVMHLAAVALAIGLVVALSLKETAPIKQGTPA